MPPEENKINYNPNPVKIGLDPVFKGNPPSVKVLPVEPPFTKSPEPVFNNSTNHKSVVRTYKSDMEATIQADHLSSINIAIAENEKMHSKINVEQKAKSEELAPAIPSDYSKNKIIIFISIILILIGAVSVGITFLVSKQNSNPVVWVQELPSLITTEYKNELNIDTVTKGKFVITLLGKINDSPLPLNNFSNTYITTGTSTQKRLVTSGEFISLAEFKIPDIMKRTLLPDFMIGSYPLNRNLPFIIFKTSSFENTYAGMLTWEKTIEKDVQVLFRLPGYENSQGILDELTPTPIKKFTDKVIANKDTRLLRDDAGQTILLYGIIDKETIVITVNEEAFKEIINRLNKEKTLKR